MSQSVTSSPELFSVEWTPGKAVAACCRRPGPVGNGCGEEDFVQFAMDQFMRRERRILGEDRV